MSNNKVIWSPGREARLEILVNRGLSSRQIAEDMGLTKNQILGKVRRMKLQLHRTPLEAWAVDRIIELRALHSEGKTNKEAAEVLGVSQMTILNQCRRLGIKMARANKPNSNEGKFIPSPDEIYVKGKRPSAPKALPLNHPAFHEPTPTQKMPEEITNKECRWPVANGMWCGDVISEGSSYCLDHRVLGRRRG